MKNRTSVVILQHPRERLHPIGTARLAALGLDNVRVEVAWNAGMREDSAPSWLPPGAALLYPGRDAIDLGKLDGENAPRHLVVIDGTWHTARTLYRDKTWLRRLPCYRLAPSEPSRYRIRREPSRDYVSSIEAIVGALRLLEPDTAGFDELLDAFDRMIETQLSFIRRGDTAPRLRERRPRAHRRTPRALIEGFDRLVVAYGESARPDPRGPRALVQWTAVALRTGATFERFISTSFGVPTAAHLAHMGLEAEDFARRVDPMTFRAQFEAFLDASGAHPIVTAWNQSTLDLLESTTGGSLARNALKSAYRSVRSGCSGSLDDVVTKERLDPGVFPFRGRAAERVGRAVAVARLLNALATAT